MKNQEELDLIKQMNLDLEEDMQRCRSKESELLEFTQRLTETNVRLQSDLATLQEKVVTLPSSNFTVVVVHFCFTFCFTLDADDRKK